MKLLAILIICFFVNSIPINAHELWLEAENYKIKNGELAIHIKVGQDLVGESYPFINEETEKLILQSKNANQFLKQDDGNYPAIQHKVDQTGIQYLYYQSHTEYLQYSDLKTFLDFTKEYSLNFNENQTDIPTETYQRFAKIILQNKDDNFFISKPNLEFEIINQNNPFDHNNIKIQILLDNEPFIERKFIVFQREGVNFKRAQYQTDKNGFANIDTSEKGLYLISAVILQKNNFLDKLRYKTDYFSKWASLTFRKN